MAWENANVGIENQSICEVDLAWENAGGNNSYWITNAGKWQNGIDGVNCAGMFTLGTSMWIFGDSQYGLYFDGTNNMPNIHTYYNGSQNDAETGGFHIDMNWGEPTKGLYCLFIGINEETQKGTIKAFQSYYTDNRYSMNDKRTTGTNYNSTKVYEIIKHALTPPIVPITSNGGGATHIAKRAGLLLSIGASNLSDVLIVSGGGGGGLLDGQDVYVGADAGGISGNGTNSANQTTGYAFGQGESGSGVSGGGGGLYGGYKGVS